MLILFDIDGTLYHGDKSGIDAFTAAGRELFGPSFRQPDFDYSGWLDRLIYARFAEHNRVPDDEATQAAFRRLCNLHLRRNLAEGRYAARVLPGVHDLVNALREQRERVTLGLLTGNWPENGRVKVEFCGLDFTWFEVNAWSDDGQHRNDLPPVAMKRYCERHARDITPQQTLIIGDTPHDVACARAHGCRMLGVATGRTGIQGLREAGADHVVADLTATEEILDWVLSSSGRVGAN